MSYVIRQKTTPTHTFKLPFNTDIIQELEITYQQGKRNKLIKHLADVSLDGDKIILTLTQQETLLFDAHPGVDIQVFILSTQGKVLGSNKFTVPVSEAQSKVILEVPGSNEP